MQKLISIFVLTVVLLAQQAFANQRRISITPENQKKYQCNFALSIQEKGGFYQVKFEAPKEGALKTLFQMQFVIYEGDKLLLAVPLEQYSAFQKDQKPSVQFTLAKAWLNGAVLDLRTGTPLRETVYRLPLAAYPQRKP